MTTETGNIAEGKQTADPIQETRRLFNQELFGRRYNGDRLLKRTVQLYGALLPSAIPVELCRNELTVCTNQAAERAASHKDTDTALTLRSLMAILEIKTNQPNAQKDSQGELKPDPNGLISPDVLEVASDIHDQLVDKGYNFQLLTVPLTNGQVLIQAILSDKSKPIKESPTDIQQDS